jgi:hypothetical protein
MECSWLGHLTNAAAVITFLVARNSVRSRSLPYGCGVLELPPRGNTNIPTIMVAEKTPAAIRGGAEHERRRQRTDSVRS